MLNFYSSITDKKQRLKIVNEIFETYIQSCAHPPTELTNIDKQMFDDIIVIAYMILKESKVYDFTVLSPLNYYAINMVEIARKNNPTNRDFNLILIKLYDKLGCTSKIAEIVSTFQTKEDDYEKLGYLKFSHLSEYGITKGLEGT